MLIRFVRRQRTSRAFAKLCAVLKERYGVPYWYTEGQVATAAELSGQQHILEFALPVLTKDSGFDRDYVRDEFSIAYLDGDPTHDARDVVKRFSPNLNSSSSDFPNKRVSY